MCIRDREKDYVGLNWMLEDLNAEMINSRKLGVQAIITLQVRIETLRDVEAAVDVDMGNGGFAAQTPGDATGPAQIETLKRTVNVAAIAVRRKDTYRMKEEISLTGGKPNIGRLDVYKRQILGGASELKVPFQDLTEDNIRGVQ